MIATSLFSMFLLGISGLLLDAHRRTRRRVVAAECRQTGTDQRSRRFAYLQYRRRMLASGTIGLVGAAIAIAPIVPRRPIPMTIYLIVLVTACGWIMLLALADVFATHGHYRRLRGQQMSAHLKLVEEIQTARDKAK
jgi:hypothetical protein